MDEKKRSSRFSGGPSRPSERLCAWTLPIITLFFVLVTLNAPLFAAGREKVLYSFCPVSGCADGEFPDYGNLIFDTAGNLYGTTYKGGTYNSGTVFELTPEGHGWAETVLYNFCSATGCNDGSNPYSGLIFDSAGNLYGTTSAGGNPGGGTVFELSPGDGGWTETVLYNFCSLTNCADGSLPFSSLIFGGSGNLYGTTYESGAYDRGTVFQLAPGTNGKWTENVLHSFANDGQDGEAPWAALIIDSGGNLYGTTVYGGNFTGGCGTLGCGTVFELSPGDGGWTEKILHKFSENGKDGYDPYGSLIFDAAGSLYGTTYSGGRHQVGTVFELTPKVGGKWSERVLHNFIYNHIDGTIPNAGLVFDSAGNLYGTDSAGGKNGYGAVFQLTILDGKWKEKVLHSFNLNHVDGFSPLGGLVLDSAGNLYGATNRGGANGVGVVFEVRP